jgi:integrase
MSGSKGRIGRRRGKRGLTYYFVVDVGRKNGKRQQLWRGGFATKRQAQDALQEVVGRLRSGEFVEPSKLTLGPFLTEMWLPAVRSQLRPSTFESYARNIRIHVLPELGETRLQALSALNLDRLYSHLLASGRRDGRGLAPRTVRYVHTILHAALAYAARKNLVARNVAQLADPPKSSSASRPLVWTPQQLQGFLEHVAADRLAALWLVLATTGLRRGEVLGLSWRDVDFDQRRLTIRRALVQVGYATVWSTPKTESGRRTISLDRITVAALREHRVRQTRERLLLGSAYNQEDDLVFCREDGAPIHPERLTKLFTAQVKRASLPKIRLHDLRHGWASHAVAAGVDIRTVSSRLGHADAGFTMRVYAHQIAEAEERAAQTVVDVLLGAKPG